MGKTEEKYQWQGEPVSVRFGYVYQEENVDNPLYWYNFECYNRRQFDDSFKAEHMVNKIGKHIALIPAIEITTGDGYRFLLANHFGIGVNKLLKGGWPNAAHFSLDGEFKEDNAPYFKCTKFDLEGYEEYENERNKWLKKNYPAEYERMDALRQMAQRPILNVKSLFKVK